MHVDTPKLAGEPVTVGAMVTLVHRGRIEGMPSEVSREALQPRKILLDTVAVGISVPRVSLGPQTSRLYGVNKKLGMHPISADAMKGPIATSSRTAIGLKSMVVLLVFLTRPATGQAANRV